MVNTQINLTIFFATEDGDALDSQQKQVLIMSSLLQNSALNWRK